MQVSGSDPLSPLKSTIEKICRVAGVPGASVGLLHQGKVFTENFGFRDLERQIPPTSQTQYCTGSITKSFTAAAIGKLLDDKELKLETEAAQILPKFKNPEGYHSDITVGDLLTHRTGLSGSLSLTFQGRGDFLLERDQLYPMVNNLPIVGPFRSEWRYNNWGYALVGAIIEEISGQTVQEHFKQTICTPLGLDNTTTRPVLDGNHDVAKSYAALDDGLFHPLPYVQEFQGTFFEAAGGMYSNVDDLLKWGNAMIKASRQPRSDENSTLKQIPMLFSNHIPILNPSLGERSYGPRWVRTQLPGVVGLVGDNVEISSLQDLQELAKGCDSRLVIYHQGSTVGYYSAIYLDLKTESVVVVLTNSIAIGDAADWISQTVLQALIEPSEPTDYTREAFKMKSLLLSHYDNLKRSLVLGRNAQAKGKPRKIYVGKYFNKLKNFHIEVREDSGDDRSLIMMFQGMEKHRFQLRHYQEDTFEWSLSFNETAYCGRYHCWNSEYFKIRFVIETDAQFSSTLIWKEDVSAKEGQQFRQNPPMESARAQTSWYNRFFKF